MTFAFPPQLFAILSQLIEDKLGLHYEPADADLLRDRISPRAMDAGFDSLLDYYYFLRYDEQGDRELRALTDALTVRETYFFREFAQLQVAVDRFVVPLVGQRGHARLWSAACATGEEPLTLAMLLQERGVLSTTRILASDISDEALGRAREGVYSKRALRVVPRPQLVSRFLREVDGKWMVDRALLNAVEWRNINLLHASAGLAPASFDVIFCRNVLIYFSDRATRSVIQQLEDLLAKDGALFVGAAESLLRLGTALRCEEQEGVFFYQRHGNPDPSTGGG